MAFHPCALTTVLPRCDAAAVATSVLLVDDHQFTRVTLGNAIAARGLVVHAVGSAREALAWLETVPGVDVALLDLDLGTGPTGLDLAQELRRRIPAIGIVLLTSYRDPRLAGRDLPGLPIGGVYLCKDEIEDLESVIGIIAMVRHLPLARRPEHGITAHGSALTDVQVDVLTALAAGATTAQIAKDRGVSEGAIEKTIARICERLDIPRDPHTNQRVQLVHAFNQMRGLA
jgi:DNA-binding NarL/FixJ family response regulator